MKRRYWIYGKHTVLAALKNSLRCCFRMRGTRAAIKEMELAINESDLDAVNKLNSIKIEECQFDKVINDIKVHQGIALEVEAFDRIFDADALSGGLVLLDKLSDPHNIGAIMRSAAAFGIKSIAFTKDGSPKENGVIAKSACGAMESVKYMQITNLAREISALQKRGYNIIGLAGDGSYNITEISFCDSTAFILGSEGSGLRRLIREKCDMIVSIPMDGQESINVSNAAAVTFFKYFCR